MAVVRLAYTVRNLIVRRWTSRSSRWRDRARGRWRRCSWPLLVSGPPQCWPTASPTPSSCSARANHRHEVEPSPPRGRARAPARSAASSRWADASLLASRELVNHPFGARGTGTARMSSSVARAGGVRGASGVRIVDGKGVPAELARWSRRGVLARYRPAGRERGCASGGCPGPCGRLRCGRYGRFDSRDLGRVKYVQDYTRGTDSPGFRPA